MIDKVNLLTNDEFILLAAAAGMSKLYGFDMNPEQLQRDEAIYVLQGLTQKGFIVSNGQNFSLIGEMKIIFEQIKECDSYIEVHKKSGRKCMLYIGTETIKVAQSMKRPQIYELMKIETAKVWRNLMDEGWIRYEEAIK